MTRWVYRHAEEPPGGGSFLFALSALAALGHLSQRERQGTLTRCIERGIGRQDRACGRGERIPTPVCTPRALASRRAPARNDRERTMCGRPFVGADDPVCPSPTQSARLPRRRRLDNGAGMGIIKIRGRCDKRSALYDNDFFRKKPSPARVAVSAFYDDRDRERPDM